MKLSLEHEVKWFQVPVWADVTIALSHVGQKDTLQAITDSEIRKVTGRKGLQIAQSNSKYIERDYDLTISHVHGWTGIDDEKTGKPVPFTKENFEKILNNYGKLQLPADEVKRIRDYISTVEDYSERENDPTPTNLSQWIAFIQRDRKLFDEGTENLGNTAPVS